MKTNTRRGAKRIIYFLVAVVLVSYVYLVTMRPLPNLTAQPAAALTSTKTASKLTWPASGQASVSILDTSILETHGAQTPVPIASTAKIITVLNVLKTKPLQLNQAGPMITLTASDVAIYNAYAAQHGSVVPVQAGEQISEYQMLQAIMLPSANNMADSLAIWTFGSLDKYAAAANLYLSQHHLRDTHVGSDASGFAPNTTSTAQDLAKLGALAMQNPVLAQVASQSTATGIPNTTTINNVNMLLGNSGIIGVKTGNTDEAGGVFVGAARATVNNKPIIIITAVAGTPNLFTAMKTSLSLIRSAQANFSPQTIVKRGDVIGTYSQPWGGNVQAIAAQSISESTWNDSAVSAKADLRNITTKTAANSTVGTVGIPGSGISGQVSSPVTLHFKPTPPSIVWRLKHPF